MGGGLESVAIVGGGPAGSTLAALLAEKGLRVAVLHTGKRPELIVGESLVPAVVPILARLGVEERVSGIATYKPGATVGFGPDDRYPLPFVDASGELPPYSYNVPRDAFDALLLENAERSGARVIDTTARVERAEGGRLVLSPETRALASEAFDGRPPDVVVDASGRARLAARALGLPGIEGRRKDVALFAHFDRAALDRPGDIHVDRVERGWSWRIPLPAKVSIGIVVDPKHLPVGVPRADAFDAFVARDPLLSRATEGAKRLTKVVSYTNYQLRSPRLHGPGWALVGDAAGFADPIFSTGAYLAMRGAELLADALLGGAPDDLDAYQARWLAELTTWQRIIDLWYDGRIFRLLQIGRTMRRLSPARPVDRHVARHMTRIFTGEAGRNGYGLRLLSALAPMGRVGAEALAIR